MADEKLGGMLMAKALRINCPTRGFDFGKWAREHNDMYRNGWMSNEIVACQRGCLSTNTVFNILQSIPRRTYRPMILRSLEMARYAELATLVDKDAFLCNLQREFTKGAHNGTMLVLLVENESHFTLFDAPNEGKGYYHDSHGLDCHSKLRTLIVEMISGLRTLLGITEGVEWEFNDTHHQTNNRDCGVHAAIAGATRLGALTPEEAAQCRRDIRGTRESIGAYAIAEYTTVHSENEGCLAPERKKKRREAAPFSTGDSIVVNSDSERDATEGTSSRGQRAKRRGLGF